MKNFKEQLPFINTIVLELDGVLSGGKMLQYGSSTIRSVHAKDIYALRLAVDKGICVTLFIPQSEQEIIRFYNELGIDVIPFLTSPDEAFISFKTKCVNLKNIIYLGYDVCSISSMKESGIVVCPKDAAPEIKSISAYVSTQVGGEEFVRDVIEQVLKSQEKWFPKQ